MPVDSQAGEKPRPKPTPKPAKPASAIAPVAEVVAPPTPKPKKPSFFEKLFGNRKRKPAPEPTPTPSPTPRKSVRKPAATPAPPLEPGSTPKPVKTAPVKTEVPKVASATPVASAAPPKKTVTTKPAISEPKKNLIEPPADADPDVKEKYRYEQAKARAMEDPQVKSLKAKADDASTEDDSRKALRAYNKALFEKIRKIDSSVSERADLLEAGILKRLSE